MVLSRSSITSGSPFLALRSTLHGSRLLNDVRQLVCQQPLAVFRRRAVLTAPEDDVTADGEGTRIHRPCKVTGVAVGMDAHGVEVVTDLRFHTGPHRGRKRGPIAWQPSDALFHWTVDRRRITGRRPRPHT